MEVRGIFFTKAPKSRKSWLLVWAWITDPAQMNKSALNIAWVIRWKKVNIGACIAKLSIITPNCLKVESAMIFFMSFSTMAANPAINVVEAEEIKSREEEKEKSVIK